MLAIVEFETDETETVTCNAPNCSNALDDFDSFYSRCPGDHENESGDYCDAHWPTHECRECV